MTTVTIPKWTPQGVLPPIDPVDPISVERSPYSVSLKEFALHFGSTVKRREVLTGYLNFRKALHTGGLVDGFQWVDGSFLEGH